MFTKKWAEKMASQMIMAYKHNKKTAPNLTEKEVLRRMLHEAPDENIAKKVLNNSTLWEDSDFSNDEIFLEYVIELWKSYFNSPEVPANKRQALEAGVKSAVAKNL